MRYRTVHGKIQSLPRSAEFLGESHRCVVVVFRIVTAGKAPRSARYLTGVQGTDIVLSVGAKSPATQPAPRDRESLMIVRIILTGQGDARHVAADELAGI